VKINTLVEKFAVGANTNITQYLFEENMLKCWKGMNTTHRKKCLTLLNPIFIYWVERKVFAFFK
jgi:hypothetical protein